MNLQHKSKKSATVKAIENGQIRYLKHKTEIFRNLAKQYPVFSKWESNEKMDSLMPPPLLQENPKPQSLLPPLPPPLPLPSHETPLSPPPPPPPPPPPSSSQENQNLELPLEEPYESRIDPVIEEHISNIKRISSNLKELINGIGHLPVPLNQTEHFQEPFHKINFGPPKSKSVLNSLEHCVESVNGYLTFFEMNNLFIDGNTINSAISELVLILGEFLALDIYIHARVGHI
ncbi:hypothetical protein ACTFIY_009471 [Dictyostelium cf. discoideum]